LQITMDALTQVGDVLPTLTLRDVDGNPVALGDLLDRPLAVPLVRYYGCMPCRDFLVQLNEARPALDAVGVGVVGVGGAADYQARHLMGHGIGFRLLLDPDHQLYEALDVRRIHWWMLLMPTTWWKYLRAARRARQGRITAHPLQAPGFVILDTDRTVRFLYRGRTLGDYPPVSDVVAAAVSLGRPTA
jgi:peroxiredoxin